MDYQQTHGYTRHPPPPPSAADPFQRPPVHPPLPNHPWPYAAPQFHYQPQPQTQHSPSPPPPQWPPPPGHSSDHAQYPPPPYPAHQPPPYPAHPHYPLPAPPPLPPRPPHPAQPYSQDWGSGSWIHHQSRQYPTAANNNDEDWAARAKAWAAAKSASDNQHTLPQFVPDGRPEEQNHFHNQYSQSMDPQYIDGHTPLAPASNYHHFPVAMGVSNRSNGSQLQDSRYMSSGQSSYDADTHAPFDSRDGGTAGDSIPPFLPQERSPITPLVHQQEVPSSYSSISGNLEVGDRYERLSSSSSIPVASHPQHHNQRIPPTTGRSGWVGELRLVLGSHPAESRTDMSDQPLNFAPHFNRDPETCVQPNYAYSSSISIRDGDPTGPSNYVWSTSAATGPAYPPAPPKMSFGSQADHPIAPVSGHTAQIFPSGSGFQPTVPIIGAAFGVGAGVTPRPTTFPGDAYGVAEHPKKASVPNWLREEIIKNKAVITSSNSAPNLPKEDSQSMEDYNNDKSSVKGDQSDSKSIDSSGSTEDEEDEVEAARIAAINQEIKHVLTEILLKVTDELFDEIATEVLKEDDLSVEVGRDSDLSNHHMLPSTPSVPTPKASAKVLIPSKTKGSDDKDASEKSTSGSPRDILGLASYASDEEDEIQSSRKLNSKERSAYHHSFSSKLLEGDPAIENRGSEEKQRSFPAKLDASSTGRMVPCSVAKVESNNNMAAKDTKRLSAENEFHHGYDTSSFSSSLTEKSVKRNETTDGKLEAKRWQDNNSQIKNTWNGSYKNDQLGNKKSSMKKEYIDSASLSGRLHKKGDEEHRRHEERHAITDWDDYHDDLKDKSKEKGKTDEKVKNIESRKRLSPSDNKEGTSETHRTSSKKDDEKRKERTGDERKDRTGLKSGVESSRHKRRQSSSVGARDRDNEDNSVVSRANDSNNESSDESERKSHHSRRRHKSPPSSRTRKRQVSRSPSKHSKRRHSPYSSLESTRDKRSRSRSRSPVHRRR